VFAGPDTTVFTIAPSRSLKVLTAQLGVVLDADTGALPDALPGGRRLLLSSDFYAVYQSMGRMDGVDNLWCWAHYPDLGIIPTSTGPALVSAGSRPSSVGIIVAA
jgi:hypothetical protein